MKATVRRALEAAIGLREIAAHEAAESERLAPSPPGPSTPCGTAG